MPLDETEERLLDAAGLAARIERLAEAAAGWIDDPAAAALVGVRTRGVTIARRVAQLLRERRGWELPLGALDITLYRDDLSQLSENPLVRQTEIPFTIQDRTIVLIDDVIYTGRTVRSAISVLIDFGRPRAIRLATLVDRGGRELPIQPDFVALNAPASPEQIVKVRLKEDDGMDGVALVSRAG
jgi:pyrimidine operon attenuation protein/uracil phosphoribosyltransferase